MSKRVVVDDGITVELDDDITELDLGKHPSPENALSADELRQIAEEFGVEFE